jgi:LETM1 and EF-hand domain-containing protein 1, mitochondrial
MYEDKVIIFPIFLLNFVDCVARRGIILESVSRRRFATDDVVKVLAVTYVNGFNQWKATQPQHRDVSTETRPSDPKPFPLPITKPQQQSNARAPPPPMPPQPPRTEPPRKPESEQSVSSDAAKPAMPTVTPEATVAEAAALEKKDEKADKKLTIWQKVKKEAVHYWDGTKLLGKEIRISFRLALKMAAGYELSRRESRQLKRTTEDLIRLVPFSVFVIVPFAELLLPVALKLFPNMLPSTYEGETAKEAKRKALSKTRKDVSKFLRTTIQESGLYISKATKQSHEFAEFFRKVFSVC